MLRRRHEEHEATPPTGPKRYQMRQRLIAIGDDYNIEDEHGQRAFHIDGKALRLRQTVILEDPHGHELYTIQERMARVRDSMAITRGGQKVAEVHKALVAPLRDRLDVSMPGGADLTVQGNLFDHEYEIKQGRLTLAQ